MSPETPQGKREQAEEVVAALNERDFEALSEMPFDPAMEFHSVFAPLEAKDGIYHGIQGLRQWAHAVDSIFDRFKNEIVDFRELDAERAVLIVRFTGQAKASGAPFDNRSGQIWTWRNGKMWRCEVFSDPREAFKAAGELKDKGGSRD